MIGSRAGSALPTRQSTAPRGSNRTTAATRSKGPVSSANKHRRVLLARERREAEAVRLLVEDVCAGAERAKVPGVPLAPNEQARHEAKGFQVSASCLADTAGTTGSDPRSVAYLIRPRAKKPTNARTTMMMTIHRMMEKAHLLLMTRPFVPVRFSGQSAVPSSERALRPLTISLAGTMRGPLFLQKAGTPIALC